MNELSDILKIILQIAQVIALVYAGYKFTRKPHDTLESRITTLEVEMREQKQSLLQGNDRFRENDEKEKRQDRALTIILRGMIALINYEAQYCLTEHKTMSPELSKANEELQNFLSEQTK